MEIIKPYFKKSEPGISGKIDFNDKVTFENILKYVIPVIEKNEGWGTKALTKDEFKSNPEKFRQDIQSTLIDNVTIVLANGEPVGLLEYESHCLNDENILMDKLREILDGKCEKFKELPIPRYLRKGVELENEKLRELYTITPVYHEIGYVVKPNLQGKSSDVTKKMNEMFSNGIFFAWTSSPIFLRMIKKSFPNILFFPLFSETVDSFEAYAATVLIASDLLSSTDDKWEGLEFGTLKSEFFVEERGGEYLEIVDSMAKERKLEPLDSKRIMYCIERKSIAGALFGFNQK